MNVFIQSIDAVRAFISHELSDAARIVSRVSAREQSISGTQRRSRIMHVGIIALALVVYAGVVITARQAYQAATPCVVPRLATGVSAQSARAALTDAHCSVGATVRVTSAAPVGSFVAFNMPAGTTQQHGVAIAAAISAGECRVPELGAAEYARAAAQRFTKAGCTMQTVSRRSTARPGRVLAVGADAGRQLPVHAAIPVTVSAGLAPSSRNYARATSYARTRPGNVSWAVVAADGTVRSFNGSRPYRCASLVKAMILVARLRQLSDTDLPGATRADLSSMIRASSNDAASRQFALPGMADSVRAVADDAGMTGFSMPNPFDWGVIEFTAIDQATFFSRIDRLMPARHRAWGMNELSSITPAQRWGIARFSDTSTDRWHIAFKGGWLGRPCGSIQHQAALLTRPGERYGVAVLTDCNPGGGTGQQTQQDIARLLFGRTGA